MRTKTEYNFILDTDSYKQSHFLQYPPNIKFVSSYIEGRKGMFKEYVSFGLQKYLMDLEAVRVTRAQVDEAEDVSTRHGEPFNRKGWDRIVKAYDGRIPLIIEGVPDGTVVPIGSPILQVRNFDPELYWLTSFVETQMLRAMWYPSTVATISREIKKVIYRYLKETSDDPDGQISFKLHDFGARGVSSYESAGIGGAAHLVNFMGTDTMSALQVARDYYYEPMAGFSIPAAEHSTITSWGSTKEIDAYANMLEKFGGPGKLVAVVSDSYDIYNAVETIWGEALKDQVESMGGTLVIRPDSGDPVTVILRVLAILESKFPVTVNSKGYKVLPPFLRIIQGDGVDYNSIAEILHQMKLSGWSAENIAFGMGGALLQKVNRDTLSFAMKCNAISFGEDWVPVQKKPKTDASKASKAGRLDAAEWGFRTMYDTNCLIHDTLTQVRERAKIV